jgi:hypothetical protein
LLTINHSSSSPPHQRVVIPVVLRRVRELHQEIAFLPTAQREPEPGGVVGTLLAHRPRC